LSVVLNFESMTLKISVSCGHEYDSGMSNCDKFVKIRPCTPETDKTMHPIVSI